MVEFKWKDSMKRNKKMIVYLDKKHVGVIKKVEKGWCYFPKGQKVGGKVFTFISDCERSLL